MFFFEYGKQYSYLGHNWPTLQHGLSAIAELLVVHAKAYMASAAERSVQPQWLTDRGMERRQTTPFHFTGFKKRQFNFHSRLCWPTFVCMRQPHDFSCLRNDLLCVTSTQQSQLSPQNFSPADDDCCRRRKKERNCNDFECVGKPTESRFSLTHCTNKSSR